MAFSKGQSRVVPVWRSGEATGPESRWPRLITTGAFRSPGPIRQMRTLIPGPVDGKISRRMWRGSAFFILRFRLNREGFQPSSGKRPSPAGSSAPSATSAPADSMSWPMKRSASSTGIRARTAAIAASSRGEDFSGPRRATP